MRIFSGIQPTGRKHLGNYLGAITQYVEGQDRADPAIYCIVDLHATGVSYDPKALPEYVLDTTATLMAAGLDPGRCILFRQSDVREHTELCWLLSSVTAYGELQRMTQFKEKSEREQELVRTALFLYPVLQAADILLYRTDEVPVGDDQRQHVELAREIARRFNTTYGDVLVEPAHRIPEVGARIMDLQDPASKMSTTSASAAGRVYIDDEAGRHPAQVQARRDRLRERGGARPGQARHQQPDRDPRRDPGRVAGGGGARVRRAGLRRVQGGGGRVRGRTSWRPVRERYVELRADEAALEAALQEGAERARSIATGVMVGRPRRDGRRTAGLI